MDGALLTLSITFPIFFLPKSFKSSLSGSSCYFTEFHMIPLHCDSQSACYSWFSKTCHIFLSWFPLDSVLAVFFFFQSGFSFPAFHPALAHISLLYFSPLLPSLSRLPLIIYFSLISSFLCFINCTTSCCFWKCLCL